MKVSVTAPWKFFGGPDNRWWHYLWPRRITLSSRDRKVFRWICFNIAPKGWPTR